MKLDWRTLTVIGIVLLAVSIPFLIADKVGGQGFVFNGFLFNPMDGNSYLAKMVEGARGDWKFTLPYTADPGQGAFLFLFYILLGKLAGLFSMPMLFVFHTARLLCTLFLLMELRKFCISLFPENSRLSWHTFVYAALFTGMGWLAIVFGRLSSDLNVPEAFTFFSAYANPHFPLSLALILFTLRKILLEKEKPFSPIFLLIGFILANLSPFSIVICLLIIGCCKIWLWIQEKTLWIWNGLFFFLGGIPVLFYQYFVVKTDPVFAEWNAQNLTPAPALVDLLLAFLPGLIFAALGLILSLRRKSQSTTRLLVVWFLAGFILTYMPFNLQRRFLIGLSIPVAALAMLYIDQIKKVRLGQALNVLVFVFMLPTHLMIMALGITSVAQHNPNLTYTVDESKALGWIENNTRQNDIILAAPEMGTLIPAYTGRRVIYGHLFETTFATQKKQDVLDFYGAKWDVFASIRYLGINNIRYIFWGPREKALGNPAFLYSLPVVFSSGNVDVLGVGSTP